MTMVANIIRLLVRGLWLVQLALGVLFWTGNQFQLIQTHMLVGMLLVLLLWTTAVLAAIARVEWRLVGLAFVWGVVVFALGMTQTSLVPGDLHWIVQVLHLVLGVGLIALVENLAARIVRLIGASRSVAVSRPLS